MSIKEALKNYKNRTKVIKFCGQDVTIQSMSGNDFAKFSGEFDAEKCDVNRAALILAYSIVEDGKRVFGSEDIEDIAMVDYKDLQRAAKEASVFCGLSSDKSSKEAEGNS